MSIKSELLAIQKSDPQRILRAEVVHRWAKAHKNSALYRSIEWNASKAAYEYQLWQIRRMISLTIVMEDGTPQLVSLRIDRARAGGGYRAISDVLSSKELSQQMLDEALDDLTRIQDRYKFVKELTGVWHLVSKIRSQRQRRKRAA